MAPRAYNSTKRADSVEKTRRRITEAVVQLHREKGVTATTYDDIARRADVAPATVYRHFPTVDDLIPACGARILEITAPPGPGIFERRGTPAEMLRTLVDELFGYWGRADSWLSVGRCEAAKVPALAAGLRDWDVVLRALIVPALGERADDHTVNLVKAMTDFYTWKALAAAGLEDEAAAIITGMLSNHLGIKE
jgi:AcrR family transcriptional regulator